MKKVVSCGFIIRYDDLLFTVHPTGMNYQSIPKGVVDENETYLQCAIRELKEETDIDIYKLHWYSFKILGLKPYLKTKDLYLIEVLLKDKLDITKCKCNSYFTDKRTGKKLLEVDSFKWIKFNEYEKKLNMGLIKVFNNIYKGENNEHF